MMTGTVTAIPGMTIEQACAELKRITHDEFRRQIPIDETFLCCLYATIHAALQGE